MKFIIIFVTAFSTIISQDISSSKLDSLYNLYIKIKVASTTESVVTNDSLDKCAFGIVNLIQSNIEKFSPDQQLVLRKLASPPVLQKSVFTSSGFFKVNFDTSGTNSIKYSINELLEAIDSSYNYQVNYLGYPPPPVDRSGVYNIYIQNIGSTYGYTETSEVIDGKISSFIVLDNDFASTATKGIAGARVTAAHELHHAIQIGNYKFAEEDIFFHELSSTAMEEFVFDSVNDYYYYMDEYFNNPDLTFPAHSGYDLAIWNMYLASEFGQDILKRQWELIVDQRALDAIAFSISEQGSNFPDAFHHFGIWSFFTGYRKLPGRYFEEAEHYPVVRNVIKKVFTPPSDSISIYAEPVSQNYFTLYEQAGIEFSDTLTILISNSDYKAAISNPDILQYALYQISIDSSDGMNYLAEGYYQRMNPGTSKVFWASSEFLNNQLIKEGYVSIETQTPFPSPFRYSKHNIIYFPVMRNLEMEVELNIYSVSMDLVFNERKDISFMFGKDIISWNVRSSENQKLGSGVYIYVIKSGDEISKGKIVVFND